MKKIFLFCFLFLILPLQIFASDIRVEDIFSDISSDYRYRNELQELYDRGMIIPDTSGKFGPNEYLNRDEFVGISMEVICNRCIQPHTEFQYIEKFLNEDVYFDINSTNKYFYCVAEADAENFVRGYDVGESCQDGTNQFGKRPFCPLNRINLEEAIAVLLRNSGIFTIADNNKVIADIYADTITQKLGNDINPTDSDGNPYTFYGYIRKALDYKISIFDENGDEKTLRLLELNSSGDVNPDKFITKEEFLRMSYVALKSNNCSETQDSELALKMKIWEKSCNQKSSQKNTCNFSGLNDPDDTYDFEAESQTTCESGINNETGYIWRFQHMGNGQQFLKYGKYVDDYSFLTDGEWRIHLRAMDECGNIASIYSTIFVGTPQIQNQIDVDIDIYDDPCRGIHDTCKEIEFEDEEDDGDDTFDFDGDVNTSCRVGEIQYDWDITHIPSGQRYDFEGEYIDNFEFSLPGEWKIFLTATDGCGNRGSEQETYIVFDESGALDVTIQATPILGYEDLVVDFEGIVSGGEGPYTYEWNFGDGGRDFGRDLEYMYDFFGIYEVLLIVTDKNGLTGTATVVIQVLNRESCEDDSDSDGIPDCDDICPLVGGTQQNEGCPIHERACDANCSCPEGYSCTDSDPLTCGTGQCIPTFEPSLSCLFNPNQGSIFGTALCNSCPCSVGLDFLSDMRRCDVIFPAITSPNAREIYSRGEPWFIQ